MPSGDKGLTQADVAGLLGVTQQSYAKIEANPAVTSVERLFTILRLLGSEIVLIERADCQERLSFSVAKPATAKKTSVAAPQKIEPPSKKTGGW
jgi:HTH-type transcriptional regulator/antitoxin HipB